jgi:hypothetical protein
LWTIAESNAAKGATICSQKGPAASERGQYPPLQIKGKPEAAEPSLKLVRKRWIGEAKHYVPLALVVASAALANLDAVLA